MLCPRIRGETVSKDWTRLGKFRPIQIHTWNSGMDLEEFKFGCISVNPPNLNIFKSRAGLICKTCIPKYPLYAYTYYNFSKNPSPSFLSLICRLSSLHLSISRLPTHEPQHPSCILMCRPLNLDLATPVIGVEDETEKRGRRARETKVPCYGTPVTTWFKSRLRRDLIIISTFTRWALIANCGERSHTMATASGLRCAGVYCVREVCRACNTKNTKSSKR